MLHCAIVVFFLCDNHFENNFHWLLVALRVSMVFLLKIMSACCMELWVAQLLLCAKRLVPPFLKTYDCGRRARIKWCSVRQSHLNFIALTQVRVQREINCAFFLICFYKLWFHLLIFLFIASYCRRKYIVLFCVLPIKRASKFKMCWYIEFRKRQSLGPLGLLLSETNESAFCLVLLFYSQGIW